MRWYSTLNRDDKSLLSREEIGQHSLIICRQLEYRNFSIFYDYLEYAKHSYKVETDNRCFYEVILGERPQKIYFDIDTTTEEMSFEEAEKNVIIIREGLRDFLNDLKIPNFSILIFTSFGDSSKISYHIIVDGVAVLNYKQNSVIHRKIIEKIGDASKIIDDKVYKPIQQFRIWECCKYGEPTRIKTLSPLSIDKDGKEWLPENITSDKKLYITILKASLVTQVDGLLILPPFELPPSNRETHVYTGGTISIEEGMVEKVFSLYQEIHNTKNLPFRFQEIVQDSDGAGMILCHRTSPSHCKKCERIHENENPFFLIFGEELNVSFYCRRSDEGLFLGSLKMIETCEKVVSEPPSTPKIQNSGVREMMKSMRGKSKISEMPRDLQIQLKKNGVRY